MKKLINNHNLKILNIFLAVVCVGVIAVRFYYTDKIAVAGNELAEVENQIAIVEQENEIMKVDIFDASSLSAVNSLAQERGYAALNVEFMSDNENLAKLP